MTVFDVFKQIDYIYYTISRGGVYGNRITASDTHKGVFKLRSGMNDQGNNMELTSSSATLHVHPEDFEGAPAVGNAVEVNGTTYNIAGVTEGMNFESGIVEHYTLTLEATDLVPEDL